MVVRNGAIHLENHRYFREETGHFVRLEPLASLEGDAVRAFLQVLAFRIQTGNPTLFVGRGAVEHVPVLAVLFFQRDVDPGEGRPSCKLSTWTLSGLAAADARVDKALNTTPAKRDFNTVMVISLVFNSREDLVDSSQCTAFIECSATGAGHSDGADHLALELQRHAPTQQ